MKLRWSDLFPYLVIICLLVVIWFNGCEREVRYIEIPEEKGEFETRTEIVYVEVPDTVYVDRWREVEVSVKNPVNQDLIDRYQNATDSITRLNLYIQAIQERQFAETFEDEYLRADVSGLVRGELLGLNLDYTIKPRTIEAPETRFRILGGFSIGNNSELSQFRWKASIGLQNGQGNIFRLGYGDNETIWLGYEASLIRF